MSKSLESKVWASALDEELDRAVMVVLDKIRGYELDLDYTGDYSFTAYEIALTRLARAFLDATGLQSAPRPPTYRRYSPVDSRLELDEPEPKRRKALISPVLRWRIYARDDYACIKCGSRVDLSIDHIHPESLGGTLDESNLQTLCKPCNSAKGARI